MPGNFVSVMGKWFPRKESAMMTNTFGKVLESDFITAKDGSHRVEPGENFLYNGPNREAVKMLKADGVDFLGRDFKTDPEFLQAVRTMGFNNYKEYLEHFGFNEKEEIKKQMELVHELADKTPKLKDEIVELAGGRDFTGNKANNFIGGFGPERLRSPNEIKGSTKGGSGN